MKKRTQVERLVSYLKRHKRGITTLEAATELGICSLHRRIADAYDAGYVIHGRFQDGTRHLRYKLIGNRITTGEFPRSWGVVV
jgi:hypothetical protein